jgi:hypothetical protein
VNPRSDADTVTLTAVSFESLALARPLAFPAPLAHLASSPSGFEYWWKLLQFAFNLPAPESIPPLPTAVSADDQRSADRYCAAAEELATSTLLGRGAGLQIRGGEHGRLETVITDFPSGEATRGFSTLFRQFYANDDKASYQAMQRLLRNANDASEDAARETRKEHLNRWARAQGQLRAWPVKVLVGRRLIEEGTLFGPGIPGEDSPSPEQLIKVFNYGELIHWGEASAELDSWKADSFKGPWRQMEFYEAVAGLAHLYNGFSLVVRSALRGDDRND